MAEKDKNLMRRLDRGFRSLRRRMKGLEQQMDTEWKETVGGKTPEESEPGSDIDSEEDTEVGEDEEGDTRDEESVAEGVAEGVAGGVAGGRVGEEKRT